MANIKLKLLEGEPQTCFECGTTKTNLQTRHTKKRGTIKYPIWHIRKGHYVCHRCYSRLRHQDFCEARDSPFNYTSA